MFVVRAALGKSITQFDHLSLGSLLPLGHFAQDLCGRQEGQAAGTGIGVALQDPRALFHQLTPVTQHHPR